MNEPRKHHFIPQCYLRNFSVGEKRKQVFLIDAVRNIECKTSIVNVAQRRDFNRVNINGIEPNYFEKNFSKFEEKVSCSIKLLMDSDVFKNDVKDNILNLIALLAVRSPQKRNSFAKSYAQTIKIIMELSLATRQRWEGYMEKFSVEQRVSYEIAKDFFESERYTISTPRETHIRDELKMMDTILPYLYARKWQLLKSNSKTGIFFTSDNPVVINWNEPEKIPQIYRNSPGFGMKNTTIYFPLTSSYYLIGRFDIDEDALVLATDEMVAVANTAILMGAYEQLYSPSMNAFINNENSIKYPLKDLLSKLNFQ